MYGYIYLTTNLINSKKYIGQHRGSSFDNSYIGSGAIFKKALKRYEKENFSTIVLCECDNEDELNQQEQHYIERYNAVEDKKFYNIQYGGYRNGNVALIFTYNKETDDVQLIPDSVYEEYVKQGYVRGNRPRTEEQRSHYVGSRSNTVIMTKGSVTKYVDGHRLQEYLDKGYVVGRPATRPNQKSEHRKWVHNDTISLMVRDNDLEKYLCDGYSLGRAKFKSFNRVASAHNKGKIEIMKDSKSKYVTEEELPVYLENGWLNKRKHEK